MRVLVTGAAGFIGSHLIKEIYRCFDFPSVVGIDNMDDYYDVSLKQMRLEGLSCLPDFTFVHGSITDKSLLDRLFDEYRPEVVVNLAAKVGVRHSVSHPEEYIQTNINGFFNVLEACRTYGVGHLVYASSSSVYGANQSVPYAVEDKVDSPKSVYAATKKSNELMAYSYSSLYGLPVTGLRFFTVYGPAGRPDMAYYSFTEKLVKGERIQIFNHGECMRDFTFIDDVAQALVKVMQTPPQKSVASDMPYAVYNVGNSQPENLMEFVRILKEELVAAGVLGADFDLQEHVELVAMQSGDVEVTYADTSALERDFGFKPSTSLRDGLRAFAQWYYDNNYKSNSI